MLKIPAALLNAYVLRNQPLSIVHFITDRCNARCPHCFIDFNRSVPKHEMLTIEEITTVSKTLGSGLINVNITGGEPFLRSDLFEITAAYSENAGARNIVITTNGTLTEKVGEFVRRTTLSSLGSNIKISVSIDDLEEYHDRGRGIKGAFRSAIDAYNMINSSSDPRIMADIALTVTPFNAQRVEKIHGDLRSRGIEHITPILMRRAGVFRQSPQLPGVIDSYLKLSSLIEADRVSRPRSLRHLISESFRHGKNSILRNGFIIAESQGTMRPSCMAGILFGVILSDGSVAPCEMLDGGIGNLRDTGFDFMRLWKSSSAVNSRLAARNCSCTYECAWTVNVLAKLSLAPRLIYKALDYMICKRKK